MGGVFANIWAFLSGRSTRLEFWLSLLGLFVINVALGLARLSIAGSLISLPISFVIVARRLHDFNRTGFWGLLPFLANFTAGFIGGFARGAHLPVDMTVVNLVAAVISLLALIVIGVWPGTRGRNRFGSRPGSSPVADEFA